MHRVVQTQSIYFLVLQDSPRNRIGKVYERARTEKCLFPLPEKTQDVQTKQINTGRRCHFPGISSLYTSHLR